MTGGGSFEAEYLRDEPVVLVLGSLDKILRLFLKAPRHYLTDIEIQPCTTPN